MNEEPFKVWQSPDGKARFVFSHSSKDFTTGVLILQPGAQLPKHNRPLGFENLTQLSGKCEMTVFDVSDNEKIGKTVDLEVGDILKMQKGQWHIHANPHNDISITFFKLVGDITEIMKMIRNTNVEIKLRDL
jgi:quercetin dioxygenase-like cupin family protein